MPGLTNPTDPAAVAVAESVYDTFPLPIKGAKECAAREVQRYGDQREKAAVERVVAWLREPQDTLRAPIVQHTIDVLSDMIERGDYIAHKEVSDGTA